MYSKIEAMLGEGRFIVRRHRLGSRPINGTHLA